MAYPPVAYADLFGGIPKGGINPQPPQDEPVAEPVAPPRAVVDEATNLPTENDADTGILNQKISGAGEAAIDYAPVEGQIPQNPPALQGPHFDTGRYGPGNLEAATVTAPQKMGEAIGDMQNARRDYQKELDSFYKNERGRQINVNATMEAQRQRDMAVYQQRMAAMDQKANQIAAHQYDSGAFWRSPGGFLATLGAVFATMASRDHEGGMRLMNSFMDREARGFQQEHENMQADLLGLKTNTQEYRQLMGDKQAGDLLHEAKMREVAGMKLQEIASQLQSKEYIAKAELMRQDLNQQAAQLRMQAFNMAFDKEQFRQAPLAAAHMSWAAQDPNSGIAPKSNADNAAAAVGNGISAGGILGGGGSKSVGDAARGYMAGKTPASEAPPLPEDAPAWFKVIAASREEKAAKADMEHASKMEQQTGIPAAEWAAGAKASRASVLRQAMLAAGKKKQRTDPQGWLDDVNKNIGELEKKREEVELPKISEQLSQISTKTTALSKLRQANKVLMDHFRLPDGSVDSAAIDAHLGQDWKTLIGPGYKSWLKAKEQIFSKKGQVPDAEMERTRAAIDYASKLQNLVNAYGKENFGGAITNKAGAGESEGQRFDTVIAGNSGFSNIVTWVNDQASDLGYRTALVYRGYSLPSVRKFLSENQGLALPKVGYKGRPGKR